MKSEEGTGDILEHLDGGCIVKLPHVLHTRDCELGSIGDTDIGM